MTDQYKEITEATVKLSKEIQSLVEIASVRGINLDRTMQRIQEANQSLAFCVAAIQTNLDLYADSQENL